MDRQSSLSKKNLKTINPDKRDWMEELNLPPALAKFLQEQRQAIEICLAVGLLLVVGYFGTTYYLHRHLENGTGMLARAAAIQNPKERKAWLEEVVKKYGGSDAGLWARIDLAHQAYAGGKYDEAIKYFRQALAKAESGNSIVPLLEYGLANAYEQKKDFKDAEAEFHKLAGFKPFDRQAFLGEGRIREQQGDLAGALKAYQKVLNLGEKDRAGSDDWLAEKVHALQASQAASDKKGAQPSTGKKTAGGSG